MQCSLGVTLGVRTRRPANAATINVVLELTIEFKYRELRDSDSRA